MPIDLLSIKMLSRCISRPGCCHLPAVLLAGISRLNSLMDGLSFRSCDNSTLAALFKH